ncbi:hypothetical protein FHS21_004185 [Phyllobacterium trifolii]|jgi:hypothetical protein|uniref:Uncharacterized protein n=1 Tax=Phyllobacterium trifolii TaxID=300193 RepID=A0A839UD53_9HYPH|nr:hypothetical protein [Phyllobacterium trifolii]
MSGSIPQFLRNVVQVIRDHLDRRQNGFQARR